MKTISLSRGKVALVSDEDYASVAQFKWCYSATGYAVRSTWPDNKLVYMHRFILGATKGSEVDHVNGDGLDNRRSNIRVCTRSQNMANRKAKGMYWDKGRNRWVVRVYVNRKVVFYGRYKGEAEASEAYIDAKKLHHKEFVRVD